MCYVRMSGMGLFLGSFPFLSLLSFYLSQFIFLSHSLTPPNAVFLHCSLTQLNVLGLLPISLFLSVFILFLWSCQVTSTVQKFKLSAFDL